MLPERKILTVSELTHLVKHSLESTFPRVWIGGEVSNAKMHTSGHLYFTLKDASAQVAAVMWRSKVVLLGFEPEDGMKVLVSGGLTVYPPRGSYQIEVQTIKPVGIGELQLRFEQLKRKLAAEGLFDQERKRPLPEFPARIGVVTSGKGAALHDIRTVLERRFPSVDLIVFPVRVQGPGAAEEIAHAIEEMNRYGNLDVLIVGRGGGSLEDLWAFNEERVARAICHSRIPVVSAVGHEIDFTIADFVADLRAPTPSAAAEMVVRDRADLLEILHNISYTMGTILQERIEDSRNRIHSLISSYSFQRPRDSVSQFTQRLDELERNLTQLLHHRLQRAQDRQRALSQRLDALSPTEVLKRGYAIVRKEGALVTQAAALSPGDAATLQFHDGKVPTRIESTN